MERLRIRSAVYHLPDEPQYFHTKMTQVDSLSLEWITLMFWLAPIRVI